MAQNIIRYAQTERNVLSSITHPFIIPLHFAFQNAEKLFLVLEYCPGGNLGERLDEVNNFSEEVAWMYACELVLALESLHKRDVIYWDLKPDNIVIDREGHLKLTDFGLSKEEVADNISAQSFCGSIAYLAPEMIKRSGHGKAVDWYLLGVLVYEMVTGIPPFYSKDWKHMVNNILFDALKVPTYVSRGCQKFLIETL